MVNGPAPAGVNGELRAVKPKPPFTIHHSPGRVQPQVRRVGCNHLLRVILLHADEVRLERELAPSQHSRALCPEEGVAETGHAEAGPWRAVKQHSVFAHDVAETVRLTFIR